MYDVILVPVDGSAPSDAAVTQAVSLASEFDATVHVIYVVDEHALAAAGLDAGRVVRAYEEEGESFLAAATEEATAAGVDAETAIVHGTPHRDIVRYGRDHGADVVVMGTHGRRGLERALIGSVTERVLRTSDIPVLAVRATTE
jgi:nucleotide-binding universal stress UspA family protein